MAYTDPTTDVEATLTDYGRQLIARATLGDVVFVVVGFGMGRGGYDPSNFIQTTPIDPTAVELIDKVYPSPTPYDFMPFASVDRPGGRITAYNCRAGASQIPDASDYALGELALYGQIIKSNNPAEVNAYFLYALSHFPALCKTRRDTLLRRIVVSY